MHRTPEVMGISKLFNQFISECVKQNVYQHKPQLSPKMKQYFKSLSANERAMLTNTVSSFKYNPKWHETFKKPIARKRLTTKDKEEALHLYEMGLTQADMTTELGVSESTISRVFFKNGIRLIVDSRVFNLFSFSSK